MKILFTSESVTEGHPDKLCDQISDAILDEFIRSDKESRVAIETVASNKLVLIAGEVSSSASINIPSIARKVIKDVGYDEAFCGFDSEKCVVITNISKQSPDIALGVDRALEFKTHEILIGESSTDKLGAGDQGMMFGYACDETETYMPLAIDLAHKLSYKLASERKNGQIPYLRPDGKTQVTVEYDKKGTPFRIDNIVISAQHENNVDYKTLESDLITKVIKPVVFSSLIDVNTKLYINPTGKFVYGGAKADCGLTGRKIIVDTYGGYARHGGGAFSGKDPTKVDRSAAYYARYIAKNIVAAGIAKKCEVGLAYAIGVAEPVSVMVKTFGTANIQDNEIIQLIQKHFDPRPSQIIESLGLRSPIYRATSCYGHFGRTDLVFPWEKTDMADSLRKAMT